MLFSAFWKKLLSKRFLGRECLKIEKRFCPYGFKQGHAPANLASTEQWFLLTTAHFASQSKFLRKLVCNRTTFLMKSLSLRILSEKLRFPCFSLVPTGSDCPLFEAIRQKLCLLLLRLATKYLFDGKLRMWRKEIKLALQV